MDRREFLSVLAAALAAGLPLDTVLADDGAAGDALYELPAPPAGSASVLHFTDCHAQLQPLWFREAVGRDGLAAQDPRGPLDRQALQAAGIRAGSAEAYALSGLDFVESARRFGQVGGFAHLATLIARLRASRPGALLLDGGDSWQGSATALWTEGRDMVAASRALGVDLMTGHWEFTLGADRLSAILRSELGDRLQFLAQNVRTADFGERVFQPWVMRECNGIALAVIGQAYPYTPVAHPHWLMPDWTFGIREADLQDCVDAARRAGAKAVLLLSHNGLDIDLKLAGRVHGIDVILGGHTHDPLPQGIEVPNRTGHTLVTNAGSHGKFLGVLDLVVHQGHVRERRYRLLPIFSQLIPPDPAMAGLLASLRAPYRERLEAPLATTEGLLYRRGTFNGTFDEVLLAALRDHADAGIAFSPGFRWGPSLLPGDTITREALMAQTAIRYPRTTVSTLRGSAIKEILEDVCDNLFHPDPYYRQGGDMVRVSGLRYRCSPGAQRGRRIDELRVAGQPLEADRSYRVAGWASLDQAVDRSQQAPIWEVAESWLRARGRVPPLTPFLPTLSGP